MRSEFGGQVLIVVDFAIVSERPAALSDEGLRAAGDVDDGKAPVRKSDAGGSKESFAVRAAMDQRSGHARKRVAIDVAAPCQIKDAGDAAHGLI
jgi:hypothetical protein